MFECEVQQSQTKHEAQSTTNKWTMNGTQKEDQAVPMGETERLGVNWFMYYARPMSLLGLCEAIANTRGSEWPELRS